MRRVMISFMMGLMLWSIAGTVRAESASVLLEKGIYTEETAGNLDEAMGIYQKIIDDAQANRQAIAQAYYRLGRCYLKKGQEAKAVEAFQKLAEQYPEQKVLIAKVRKYLPATEMKVTEFPEIVGCRVKQTVKLTLQKLDTQPSELPSKSIYQGDLLALKIQGDSKLIESFPNYGIAVLPFDKEAGNIESKDIVWQGNSLKDAIVDRYLTPDAYRLIVFGSNEKIDYPRKTVEDLGELKLEVLFPPQTQIEIYDVRINGTIGWKIIGQDRNLSGHALNSVDSRIWDFIKVDKIFDQEGHPLKFETSHEGTFYKYHVVFNQPILPNQFGVGWMEGTMYGMVHGIAGTNDTFEYKMNNQPGGGSAPIRRIEIYRLPMGSKLISATPADMLRRNINGQIELAHVKMIPSGGTILTSFRYRLAGGSVGSKPAANEVSTLQNSSPVEEEINGPPIVVKTTPEAFSNNVSPSLSKMRVEFNQAMMDQSWSWMMDGEQRFPKTTGKPYYNTKRTICTLPVALEAGKVYWVGINGPGFKNFQTMNNVSANPYVVLFATRTADGKPTPIPEDLLEQARAINAANEASSTQPVIVSREDKIEAEKLTAEGWKLFRERKFSEAAELFEKAVARDPKNTTALNGLGWSLFKQGMPENAQVAFEKCIAIDPKHTAALNGLGYIAKEKGNINEAIQYWSWAVSASPYPTASLSGLTQTYMELKQYSAAVKYYKKWLSVEPNNAEAKAGLEKAKALMMTTTRSAVSPEKSPTEKSTSSPAVR